MKPFRPANTLILVFSVVFVLFSEPTSSIQFYDSTGTNTTARFGWAGSSANGYFEIETPNDGEPVKVQGGNVTVDGSVTAASFVGDGSGLSNVSGSNTIPDGSITSAKLADGAVLATKLAAGIISDSISWTNIKGMPAGFVDGLDNEGTPVSSIADGSITTAKLADTAVTDAKIKSVSYSKVTGAPTTMTPTDASVTAAKIATGAVTDVKLAANAVTTVKIADEAVTDAKIDSVSWGKISNNPIRSDANGNIGVGASASTSRLTVAAALNNDYVMKIQNDGTAGPSANGLYVNSNGSGYPFIVSSNNTMNLCVSYARNVGIGIFTPSAPPAAPLEIAPNGASGVITEVLRLNSKGYNSNGTGERISFYTTGNSNAAIDGVQVGGTPNGKLVFSTRKYEDGMLARMTIDQDGKVGIGKEPTTDASLLQVCGSISANSATINTVACTSDRRYKKSITPLKSCLDKISSLHGVSYSWDTDKYPAKQFPSSRQIGLIAQDVEKVVPEVVYTGPDGYKSLSYDKLSVLLIEAVKEQQVEIDSRNSLIEEQSAQIEELRKQVNQLAGRLSAIEGTTMAQ